MIEHYCFDERHDVPCPQPCPACEAECPPQDDDIGAWKRWREANEGLIL